MLQSILFQLSRSLNNTSLESIHPEQVIEPRDSLENDLALLQDILKDDIPAYIITKLDDPSSSWLAISYVPDIANIRAKMLYASSRAALTKALGSSYFTDSLFATSKADLTAASYAAHLAHNAAPNPLSAREREIAESRAAEQSADTMFEGSRARKNHVGHPVGFPWDPKVEESIRSFSSNELGLLIVMVRHMSSKTRDARHFSLDY